MADEHNLEVNLGMASAPKAQAGTSKASETEELGARLAELRGK